MTAPQSDNTHGSIRASRTDDIVFDIIHDDDTEHNDNHSDDNSSGNRYARGYDSAHTTQSNGRSHATPHIIDDDTYDVQHTHVDEWGQRQHLLEQQTLAQRQLAITQLTDTGNMERFIREFGNDILYVMNTGKGTRGAGTSTPGMWHVWSGMHWRPDTRDEVLHHTGHIALVVRRELDERRERLTMRQIREYESHERYTSSLRGRRNMLHLAAVDPRTTCDGSDMDGNRQLIGLADGSCLELGAQGRVVIRRIRRNDRISMMTAGTIDRTGTILRRPPRAVVNYLDTFIPDAQVRRRLQKTLGAALLGNNAWRIMPIIIGKSTSGKSQLTEAIEKALGDYACAAAPSILRGNLDEKPRPDIVHVIQRRIIFLNEAANTWQLHGDRIKDMTGGASFPIRSLHANTFVTLEPFFTPVIVTNYMPRITGVTDDGLRRRLVVFDFNERFEGPEDPNIKQEFIHSPDVWMWLLTWLVQGYTLACREGLDETVTAQATATDAAYESLTHTGEFLAWLRDDDRLTEIGVGDNTEDISDYAHSSWIRAAHLYKIYRAWLIEYGDQEMRRDQLKMIAFNRELQKVFHWEKHKCNGSVHWVGKIIGAHYQHIDTLLHSWFRDKTVRQIVD